MLPHRRLLTIDERLEHAAAKPVIVPEMTARDHGKVFVSHSFRASCRFLEIDFQPPHKGSPFEKGHIEKMPDSVATMSAQFLPGHADRSISHRGRRPEEERSWALPELQATAPDVLPRLPTAGMQTTRGGSAPTEGLQMSHL